MNFLTVLAEFGDAGGARRTAVHSGNMGDVLYSLPTIAALGADRLILNLVDDPGVGGRRLDRASAEFLAPLLLAQPGIRSVAIAAVPAELSVFFGRNEGEKLVSRGLPLERVDARALGVDHCLDRFRLMAADEMHLIDAHARAMGVSVDGRPAFLALESPSDPLPNDAIILSLTPRYRHLPSTFFAELLEGLGPVFLIGRPEEQSVYRGIPGTFVTSRVGVELAHLIGSGRLFVGTPSLPYAIAEGLKVKRVVDVPAWPLNAFPLGADGWMLPTDLTAARLLVKELLEGDRPRTLFARWPTERARPVEADHPTPVLVVQIAWGPGETFNPDDARIEGIELNRSHHLIRMAIPALPPSVRALGLGLSGYNGWLGISSLHVSDAAGQILWSADATELLHGTIDVPAITVRASDDPAEILWDQFDAGAHLILPIPRDGLAALGAGGDLVFALRTVPSQRWPALYRSLKAEANDLAHHAKAHAHEMVMAESAAAQDIERASDAAAHEADRVLQLLDTVEHKQQQIDAFVRSTSWRVTAPLRAATRILAGLPAAARRMIRDVVTRPSPPSPALPWSEPDAQVEGEREARVEPAPETPAEPVPETAWQVWGREGLQGLVSLLGSRERLDFRCAARPRVSIVLVLYNQAHFTLACLRSIQAHAGVLSELIIVDNASQDATSQLLGRIDGATILKNESNEGFLRAVNQAAQVAKAPFLLLLNNDARLLPQSLPVALYRLQDEPDIGAIGGQIILPDGSLQEAGSIIWRDGSCLGYSRGASPTTPEVMFTRDVDYVSGAFLLTRTALFRKLGGFDTAFAPAYYEETDFCMRLREAGHRVVYEPRVRILHYEFGSAVHRDDAVQLQKEHRIVFRRRHQNALAETHLPPEEGNELFARARPPRRERVLIIDDRIPDPSQGAGYPRAAAILRLIEAQGHFVTHYPLRAPCEEWGDVYRVVPRTVEVMLGLGQGGLAAFLRARAGYYSTVLISRPHNMAAVRELLADEPGLLGNARVIYDAEAVFALREQLQAETLGRPWTEAESAERIGREIGLAERADVILAVSKPEAAQFAANGHTDVRILGHRVEIRPTPEIPEERRGLLFVGRLEEDGSPNVDSVLWFVEHVLPEITARLGWTPPLILAGRDGAASLQRLRGHPSVQFLGAQDTLEPWYASARLFIAPSRFASGIPHKIHEAAAHGLPCVVSPVLAEQLDWQDGGELLVGVGANGFAEACSRLLRDDGLWRNIRGRALKRLASDCSEAYFQATLADVFASAGVSRVSPRPADGPEAAPSELLGSSQ